MSPRAGSPRGWTLFVRLALYAAGLPPLLVVPLGLGHRPTAALAVGVGVALCAGTAAWPSGRRAVAAAFARSRALRAADALLWNAALVLAAGELVLAVAGRFSHHPLLAAPNASARAHIEAQRAQARDYFGASALNSRGYNDTEWSDDPGDAVRIVALGDSFAFGVVGYERNFLTLLEGALTQRIGRRVEVVNLGVPGLQPRDYLEILVDEGLPLHPDLVLLCLYAGNDFQRVGGHTPLDARNWRVIGFVTRLARYAVERARASGSEPPANTARSWREPGSFSDEGYLRVASGYVPLLRRDPGERAERAFRDTFAVVDEIAARAAPAPIAIAVLPSELQVSPALRERVLERLGLVGEALDLERPARETRAHFEARGIPVIDLLPVLTAAEREAPTYRPRDSHWNERGNAVAASALGDALADAVAALAPAKGVAARGPEPAP